MYAIIDIDGTLANNAHRDHHLKKKPADWDSFLEPSAVAKDTVIEGSKRGMEKLQALKVDMIFLTGRNESLRETTATWLHNNFGVMPNDEWLLMRPLGNLLKPTEYKKEQLQRLVTTLDRNRGLLFIDDDPYVWDLYEPYGLVLKAPDCWSSMFPQRPQLPTETNWRK